jgi:BlaI family transcriptional regulator, penicillinase repressor
MASPALSRFEFRIMQALWERGPCSVREIQETFPTKKRPAYTTVQTILYRLEAKGAVQRTRKISNAHIFEAVLSRDVTQRRVIDDLLGIFGGKSQPVVAHLIESGKLTLDDIRDAEKMIQALPNRGKRP